MAGALICVVLLSMMLIFHCGYLERKEKVLDTTPEEVARLNARRLQRLRLEDWKIHNPGQGCVVALESVVGTPLSGVDHVVESFQTSWIRLGSWFTHRSTSEQM